MPIALTALIAAAGAAPAADDRPICQLTFPYRVDGPSRESSEAAQFKRLDELPPANLVLTVLRTEDGCVTPVIVRYGIGVPPKTDK